MGFSETRELWGTYGSSEFVCVAMPLSAARIARIKRMTDDCEDFENEVRISKCENHRHFLKMQHTEI